MVTGQYVFKTVDLCYMKIQYEMLHCMYLHIMQDNEMKLEWHMVEQTPTRFGMGFQIPETLTW